MPCYRPGCCMIDARDADKLCAKGRSRKSRPLRLNHRARSEKGQAHGERNDASAGHGCRRNRVDQRRRQAPWPRGGAAWLSRRRAQADPGPWAPWSRVGLAKGRPLLLCARVPAGPARVLLGNSCGMRAGRPGRMPCAWRPGCCPRTSACPIGSRGPSSCSTTALWTWSSHAPSCRRLWPTCSFFTTVRRLAARSSRCTTRWTAPAASRSTRASLGVSPDNGNDSSSCR